MFPEYSELMAKLRQDNPHFAKVLEEHDALDKHIAHLDRNPVQSITENDDIEALKRKKLKYKDELYAMLKQAELSQAE